MLTTSVLGPVGEELVPGPGTTGMVYREAESVTRRRPRRRAKAVAMRETPSRHGASPPARKESLSLLDGGNSGHFDGSEGSSEIQRTMRCSSTSYSQRTSSSQIRGLCLVNKMEGAKRSSNRSGERDLRRSGLSRCEYVKIWVSQSRASKRGPPAQHRVR